MAWGRYCLPRNTVSRLVYRYSVSTVAGTAMAISRYGKAQIKRMRNETLSVFALKIQICRRKIVS
jgi:hypothetical protein